MIQLHRLLADFPDKGDQPAIIQISFGQRTGPGLLFNCILDFADKTSMSFGGAGVDDSLKAAYDWACKTWNKNFPPTQPNQ